MALDAKCVDVAAGDIEGIVRLAYDERADLTIIGPEAPLVDGLSDELRKEGQFVFGPSKAAAQIEGSKVYAKELMKAAGIPTAGYTVLKTKEEALAQIACAAYPTVLKADGLAAGKGVIVCQNEQEARAAIDQFFTEQRFGETAVVLEEFLTGMEVSLLAICDGERAIPMAPARDYKRIFDGDRGPNTGGMGAFSPVPGVPFERVKALSDMVHTPILDEMARRGEPFQGVLYAGLMLTPSGPKVLEYNCRFGDPETQAVLPRLRTDLGQILHRAALIGGLTNTTFDWDDEYAVTITLASAGYPESSSSGDVIKGLDAFPEGIEVTHAGTAREGDEIVTAGGRVLNITALGRTPGEAREKAYDAANLISFEGMQMRQDIASGIL